MVMLRDQLQQDITTSLKAGNTRRLETLRFLLAAVTNSAIAKYGAAADTQLTDQDVLDVIKKQAKTHRESIEAFQKAGRSELVQKEQEELAILESFLPKEMSDEALKALLEPVARSGETNFGLLMKQAMAAVRGQADGGRVSAMLREMQKASTA